MASSVASASAASAVAKPPSTTLPPRTFNYNTSHSSLSFRLPNKPKFRIFTRVCANSNSFFFFPFLTRIFILFLPIVVILRDAFLIYDSPAKKNFWVGFDFRWVLFGFVIWKESGRVCLEGSFEWNSWTVLLLYEVRKRF